MNSKQKETKRIDQKSKNTLHNFQMLYEARNGAIQFFDGYFLMVSEAKHEAAKGAGLKILTPKQMLQRLTIVFSQEKVGNNSENLLNEIRQIFYSLYN